MRLSQFITDHSDAIMSGWIDFARTQLPAAAGLDETALRNDGDSILRDVVADMALSQSPSQQQDKSRGLRPAAGGSDPITHQHAAQRALHGFDTSQMVSEFRALRATVIRLWMESGRLATTHDLEDLTRFNEAIDEALTDSLKVFIEDADRRRHLFMGILGHDLRGPLHTIISCAELSLRRRPGDNRESEMILRSAAQIKALADDLLAFTMHGLNIDASNKVAAMRLDHFCQQTMDEIITLSPGRRLDLRCEGDTSGMWDGRRLHQLLWNLIVNALKYGASDQPVTIRLNGTDTEKVRLAVHNLGKPIPAELLPTLFKPLARGSVEYIAPISAGGNMGLGLYIANMIAEAHGGNIGVTSDAQCGTCFEVVLPRWSQ